MTDVGLTTTIPVEAVLAAGARPVDLNNRFIADERPGRLVDHAERDGLPRNGCAWIKGIYSAVTAPAGPRTIVAVTEGDCSNTQVLAEILARHDVEVIPFAYPLDRDRDEINRQIDRLCSRLGTTRDEAEQVYHRLAPLRAKLAELDELTWTRGTVAGHENHLWLVSSSDFGGDVRHFETELDQRLDAARTEPPGPAAGEHALRLGYLGVPPILTDLYDVLEGFGAYVVFNETQRQFALPAGGATLDEAYLRYTYPYDVAGRVADIAEQVRRRNLHGLVHYVQQFCHRGLADTLLRQDLDVPIITIEGNLPGPCDAALTVRLESFVEMLKAKR